MIGVGDSRTDVGANNVAFQKGPKTAELIQATDAALLFLPPYSPDFNPIEHDFGTVKKIREYNEHETLDSIIESYQ